MFRHPLAVLVYPPRHQASGRNHGGKVSDNLRQLIHCLCLLLSLIMATPVYVFVWKNYRHKLPLKMWFYIFCHREYVLTVRESTRK